MWLRDDVLAETTRLARSRRMGEPVPGTQRPPGEDRQGRLGASEPGQCECPGKKGGAETGPNPTDRGKPGTKRHIVVDGGGIPLNVMITGANRHDSVVFEELIDGIEPIKRPKGRPRKRPLKLHADKAYDSARCRQALSRRRIKVRIARKGVESSEKLGKHRWVVERTLAWLSKYRRLVVRYERRADIHLAFLKIGCALICLNHLQ